MDGEAGTPFATSSGIAYNTSTGEFININTTFDRRYYWNSITESTSRYLIVNAIDRNGSKWMFEIDKNTD